jgi:hypothetical protein
MDAHGKRDIDAEAGVGGTDPALVGEGDISALQPILTREGLIVS